MRQPQYSAWCFTLFYEDNSVIDLALNFTKAKYVVFGEEVCPTTGKNHLQGYFELAKKQGKKTLLKDLEKESVLLKNMSLEPRKGTQEQAVNYCKKEGKVHERGKKAKPGSRTDLDKIRTDAENNGMRYVTRIGNMQQIRVSEKYMTYNEKPRKWNDGEKLSVIYIHGTSGGGKTRMALELAGKDYYIYNPGTMGKWWEGYDGHETVIFDDIRPEHFRSAAEILTLLHEFPTRVEQKGGSRQFKAKTIIMTSILPPEEFWSFSNEPFEQFKRRLSEIVEIRGRFRPDLQSGPIYSIINNEQELREQEVGGNIMEVCAKLPNPDEEDNIMPIKLDNIVCTWCEFDHPAIYYCKGQMMYDTEIINNSDRLESEKEYERAYIKQSYESSLASIIYQRMSKFR